jgi:hypothetical protein
MRHTHAARAHLRESLLQQGQADCGQEALVLWRICMSGAAWLEPEVPLQLEGDQVHDAAVA